MDLICKSTAMLIKSMLVTRSISVTATNLYRNKARGFVDYLEVTARAGNGGDGAVMFTSESMREYCGPDGGNGGNGAHIVFRASTNVRSLTGIPSVISARSGEQGASKGCAGKSSDHVLIEVPIGTVIYEVKDNTKKLIGDLSVEQDFLVVARGGAGGRGNRAFLTNEQRAPAFAEKGGRGEQRRIAIEMKLIADMGLIGMPNAGKSSLLNALSRASPKVASYPFTTLKPHIGVMELPDARQISIADLPGIIEGAHENRGLGLAFLRHIERCRVLLYVVDVSSQNPKPEEQLEMLRAELDSYNPDLLKRSGAIVANKIDIPEGAIAIDNLKQYCSNSLRLPVVAVSAKFGANLNELRRLLVHLFTENQVDSQRQ